MLGEDRVDRASDLTQILMLIAGLAAALRLVADLAVLSDDRDLRLGGSERSVERLARLVRLPALLEGHQLLKHFHAGAALDGLAEHRHGGEGV
ncbi:hypothetical protein BTHI11S_05045 [Bosea thiooxidans]